MPDHFDSVPLSIRLVSESRVRELRDRGRVGLDLVELVGASSLATFASQRVGESQAWKGRR